MDANNSWWVSELLPAACQEAWLHPGLEDTMLQWSIWLCEFEKKDEGKWMEVEHQNLVSRMNSVGDGRYKLAQRCSS